MERPNQSTLTHLLSLLLCDDATLTEKLGSRRQPAEGRSAPRTCRSLDIRIIGSQHFLFFFFLLTTSKHEIVFLTVPTLLSSACEVCLEASCGGASPLTSLLGAPLEVRGGINMGLNSSPPTVGVCHFCQSSSECLTPLRAK